MESLAEKTWDVVILGTGITETMAGASLGKAGLSVLQVDNNALYGDEFANPNLNEFISWMGEHEEGEFRAPEARTEGMTPVGVCSRAGDFGKFVAARDYRVLCAKTFKGLSEDVEYGRRVILDRTPVLLLARGSLVEALVESGCHNYLQFMTLEGRLFSDRGLDEEDVEKKLEFRDIPCTKEDVFLSDLDLSEKRMLMRFLTWALDRAVARQARGEEGELAVTGLNEREVGRGRALRRPQNKGSERSDVIFPLESMRDAPFDAFLERVGLGPRLRGVVTCALAQGDDRMPTHEGMDRIERFLGSIGRFGRTASIVTIYGAGDIPQAFVRSASLHGAVVALTVSVTGFRPIQESEELSERKYNFWR